MFTVQADGLRAEFNAGSSNPATAEPVSRADEPKPDDPRRRGPSDNGTFGPISKPSIITNAPPLLLGNQHKEVLEVRQLFGVEGAFLTCLIGLRIPDDAVSIDRVHCVLTEV